jgi:hypothetical protein
MKALYAVDHMSACSVGVQLPLIYILLHAPPFYSVVVEWASVTLSLKSSWNVKLAYSINSHWILFLYYFIRNQYSSQILAIDFSFIHLVLSTLSYQSLSGMNNHPQIHMLLLYLEIEWCQKVMPNLNDCGFYIVVKVVQDTWMSGVVLETIFISSEHLTLAWAIKYIDIKSLNFCIKYPQLKFIQEYFVKFYTKAS